MSSADNVSSLLITSIRSDGARLPGFVREALWFLSLRRKGPSDFRRSGRRNFRREICSHERLGRHPMGDEIVQIVDGANAASDERRWGSPPGTGTGAGPFYLVWEHPERSGVTSEQWPYQLASLTAVESPAHRWPQLAADTLLPP